MNKKRVYTIGLCIAVVAEMLLFYILVALKGHFPPLINWEAHIFLNASLNFLSALCLTCAIFFVAHKKINKHRCFIHLALFFSGLFLVSYILFHLGHHRSIQSFIVPQELFYTILATHVLASIIGLPFIFITYGLALTRQISEHKKLAKFTFYLWEYISITGIFVALISLLSQK